MTGWLVGALAAIVLAWVAYRTGRGRALRRHRIEMRAARVELVQRINELFAFQELSFMLAGSLNVNPVVEQVTRYVTRFVRADGTLLALATEGRDALRVAHATGLLEDLTGDEFAEDDAGMIGEAMAHGHVEVAHADDDATPLLLAGKPFEIITVAPLAAHDAMVGALAVVKNTREPFSAEDLRLIATVATHAAVALQNARFFELVKTSKDQWETTFDALTSGIAVLDRENRIRRANRALADMLGESIQTTVGRALDTALLGRAGELAQLFNAVRNGEAILPVTRRTRSSDRVLRVNASAMPGAGDGWVVALIEDVTEREAMEAQLIQHEKLAAVGQLVSGVAHELNNPITSIAGLSDFLLERQGTGARAEDPLTLIHEQAERAGRIVRNLLAFARKGPVESAPTDINTIVRRTATLIKHEFKLREIDLILDLPDELLEVVGDRYQLQQVVLNLLTNAVDAVAEIPTDRPRHVRVTTGVHRDHVTLQVTDSGPGVPEELVPQIFTPFFTTKEPDRGTGLGLSITYRIVEGHGGRIQYQRGDQGGAVFRVSLPRGDRSSDEPVSVARHEITEHLT